MKKRTVNIKATDWKVSRDGLDFILTFEEYDWKKEVNKVVNVRLPYWGISSLADKIHKQIESLQNLVWEMNKRMAGKQ